MVNHRGFSGYAFWLTHRSLRSGAGLRHSSWAGCRRHPTLSLGPFRVRIPERMQQKSTSISECAFMVNHRGFSGYAFWLTHRSLRSGAGLRHSSWAGCRRHPAFSLGPFRVRIPERMQQKSTSISECAFMVNHRGFSGYAFWLTHRSLRSGAGLRHSSWAGCRRHPAFSLGPFRVRIPERMQQKSTSISECAFMVNHRGFEPRTP